jgi:ferritin
MLKQEIQDAINQQINIEMSSAYSYLSMAAYLDSENLSGFSKWCMLQHQEELQHAMRLFHYLLDRGGKVQLNSIPAPQSDYDSVIDVFETALGLEQKNTEAIDQIYKRAGELNDHATISHMQWFIDEQVEEEKTVEEALSLVKRAGDDVHSLLYLNDRFAARQPDSSPPA